MSLNRTLFLAGTIAVTAFASPRSAPAQPNEPFHVISGSFAEGSEIPTLYTCDGSNTSPPLAWSDPPRTARAFVVRMTDTDAINKTKQPFVHWILYNVTGDTRSINESVGRNRLPPGAREGTNDFKREGYDGPCPPSGTHHYVFTVYALDAPIDVPFYPNWRDVEPALEGHVLATATLTGTYERAKR